MRKIMKRILLVILVSFFVLLTARIVLIDSVKVDNYPYVDDYNEYYLYKKLDTSNFLFKTSKYKIWFLVGQKEKLLEKIKEDITGTLDKTVAKNSNILKGYEISSDVKKVYVYYYKDAGSVPPDLNNKLDNKVRFKVQFYNEILDGWQNTEYNGDIINYVEVDNPAS